MSNHILVGRAITAILLAEDRGAIKFVFDDGGEVIARADGDCCSQTWIEDVFNVDAALGSEVLAVEDVDLPEEWRTATKTEHYEDEMQYYGFAIDTAKGRCILAYRNSSNGYYGGNLSWPREYFYGGVHGQNESQQVWQEVRGE